jgi:hypothetical protein
MQVYCGFPPTRQSEFGYVSTYLSAFNRAWLKSAVVCPVAKWPGCVAINEQCSYSNLSGYSLVIEILVQLYERDRGVVRGVLLFYGHNLSLLSVEFVGLSLEGLHASPD